MASLAVARGAGTADEAFGQRADRLAAAYFARVGDAEPTPLATEALGTFLAAKELYDRGRHAECRDRLDVLWKRHPLGDVETWGDTDWPAGYVPLHMLTECARARTSPDWFRGEPEPWRVTAVVIGRTVGSGEVTGDLEALADPAFAEREARRAMAFFGEYVKAISRGRLALDLRIVRLENWSPPEFKEGDSFVLAVERALPPKIERTTDCWWMMVNTTNPVIGFWGGTLVEADGRQHFLGGDEWVRDTPHRKGPPADEEYAIGFSGWLLHEFYHYLFHTYTEFELEQVDHQWWYRDRWPADFEGYYETDYFAEGLHKRVQARGEPPLHVKLRHRPAAAATP